MAMTPDQKELGLLALALFAFMIFAMWAQS
jgi:hypothetical protein